MEKSIQKAEILLEALPFIKTFFNKTMVIKYGGNAMVSEVLKDNFALDLVLMKYIGINPVIVHGGGPQIGKTLAALGIRSEFVGGQRVTDKETIDVVEMVLGGMVNKEIVSLINNHGGRAVGITGKDGDLIWAKRHRKVKSSPETNRPEIIDLGLVGEITQVNPHILEVLDRHEFIPVIAPIGKGQNGETLNINADFVAAAVASALRAEKLVLMTDTEGVKGKNDHLLSELTRKEALKLIRSGVIREGMLPKVQCCLEALKGGVGKTHIIDGRIRHAILLEIFTEKGVGTQIVEK
ncbi:MAG: acetylglutamate kinase [Nitrospinaceae bacterium]|nr:acetylglutamate kinase [Nitrospinaceae bacterium]NIR57674.1 acetylglutamate kinase [Nitrospinaceae bacterium]NIS88149.1 acetylglutamate kinase [Nitrospinaceae bacterium]NIT85016.1 acetylglutamate kinase [Nitrospinaceae bacterium]NIU47185.1 acetylglutamate kinase [Nitrospinaceae bacterium]